MTIAYVVVIIVFGLLVLFVGLPLLMMFRMKRQEGKAAPELSGKSGHWLSKGRPALFYFYSPSCGACRTMTPVMKKLAEDRKGGVFLIDITQDLDTAQKFGVIATPTTIHVSEGVIQQVFMGPKPADVLEELL